MENLYRALISIVGLLAISLWFSGYLYPLLSEDFQSLLAYSGFGAFITFGGVISWGWFLLFILSLAGMLFYLRFSRLLFICTVIASLIMLPLSGILVATGVELALSDLSNILCGAILCIAFTPPINGKFKKL